MPRRCLLLSLCLMIVSNVAAPGGTRAGSEPGPSPGNRLRNGSFEGGLLYWHGVDPERQRLVEPGACGRYALEIADGYVMSAPFVAERGRQYTVSFFVRADQPATVNVQMPPSAREAGQQAHRIWAREASQSVEVTTAWRRVAFTWPADVPQSGFWPNPHYMVLIGQRGQGPIFVDGVTVTQGTQGTDHYVPRSAVEIVAECPDLPGYEGAKANLFERGAAPRVTAHVSNPGDATRDITIRWQLIDYEGVAPIAEPIEKAITLEAGGTRSETVLMPLVATGMVLARVSAVEPATGQTIDSSDLPLTSLPYPKAATRPDWRERFGGSFAGGVGCVEKHQRLGFGWIRWRPHMNGEDHLPTEPEPGRPWQWRWFDAELDEQQSRGCSTHCVLYPPPKWVMEKGHPLPTDMRWEADDPRWQDLTVETVWDKFVRGVVAHYRGRSLIYEIENEPVLAPWDDYLEEYAQFTIRTARLIKEVDPKAQVMVDNLYAIPSRVNAAFFRAGGLQHIDVMSWHDYHAGWLADATAMRRMRQNLDAAGGRHVEIWFNEGWCYTNTAVDEPIACTRLSSSESANAVFASVAELTAAGQEKTILFHTAYENHGMSFWDYSGPGTMLWDWYNYPLPIAAAWNVLAHHIGLSDEVGFVRPPGANFCIFDDLRSGRGVMIAYTDRGSRRAATVDLPDFGSKLIAEDIMGNAAPAGKRLVLSKTGRPVILYTEAKTPGAVFLQKLEPLDRRHAGFVISRAGARAWRLPPVWEGEAVGKPGGSTALDDGRPVWRLEQIWPPEPMKRDSYRPMVWTGTAWNVAAGGFGGQPSAALKDDTLTLGTRAPHGSPPQRRYCCLTFVAPEDGTYALSGDVSSRIWDGRNKTRLRVLRKGATGVETLVSIDVAHGRSVSLDGRSVQLGAGDELVLLPEIDGMYAGGNCKLRDVRIALGGERSSRRGTVYRLPAVWEGRETGKSEGNPRLFGDRPLWRIDHVWPDEPHLVTSYSPMPWDGTRWHPQEHEQGGQPAVVVADGDVQLAVRGPWGGGMGFQKIAALVFIAPVPGVYSLKGTATSRKWDGAAESFRLEIRQKDTQRAAVVESFELPSDGTPVAIEARVELTEGHELVILPSMKDAWNNATKTRIEDLSITRSEP